MVNLRKNMRSLGRPDLIHIFPPLQKKGKEFVKYDKLIRFLANQNVANFFVLSYIFCL